MSSRVLDEGRPRTLAGFADCKAVPLLNERDIINDESAPFPEGGEVLDHAFRAEQSIAAAIESPGAAERAVPRTPARKFDRRAGIEHDRSQGDPQRILLGN